MEKSLTLVIDDAVYGYQQLFSKFGKIIALPGRKIDKNCVKNADILIVRSRTKVDKNLLSGSKVCFVGSAVSGLDHIDINYLKHAHICFFSAQAANANAVAEYVISALVNLEADFQFRLSDKSLAIIGVGNVGAHLYTKVKMLGIKIYLHDPPKLEKENLIMQKKMVHFSKDNLIQESFSKECFTKAEFVDLKTALTADIISMHTPLTKMGKYPSFHLLGAHNFHHINKNTILINTARGGVIDESVWQKTPTLANVIDCWENEPHINQILRKNAYLATPHIAGHSVDAKFTASSMVYKALCRFMGEVPSENLKNPIETVSINIKNVTTLKNTLNKIYDFKQDSPALLSAKAFENYRRHYPKRYEWKHFKHFKQ